MNDPANIVQQAALRYIKTKDTIAEESESRKKPSKIQVARVILKLFPIMLNLKKDRQKWLENNESVDGDNAINDEKLRKHARKMVKTFIALGPTYIKLGQWLSTRADMLPLSYLDELAKLQDNVPPADFSVVKPIIETGLGMKIEDAFDSFDSAHPLSGASLGQVYLAKYHNKYVVVKVSRPRIEELVELDISILQQIIPLAARFIDSNLLFSADGMLSQFIETVHEEMDYRIEAENLITIKTNRAGDSIKVIMPEVFMDRTSRHVLTMEYIPGVKITDVGALEAMGVNREKLVMDIHRLFFKMLLRDDIFHADPHPGNISVADDGSIILYDFGMVGRLDRKTRLGLVRLYVALVNKDAKRTTRLLKELGTLEPGANTLFVEKAIKMSIQSMHGQEVDKMEVKALMDLANRTASRFPFRLTKTLALYLRMTTILEGIYQHHKLTFQSIKVLGDLVEEEGLAREVYFEEMKSSFERITKGIELLLNVAPVLEEQIETGGDGGAAAYHWNHKEAQARRENYYTLIAAAIFSAGLLISSSLALAHNANLAYAGYAGSVVAIGLGIILKKGNRA